jgi:hypothetical protein
MVCSISGLSSCEAGFTSNEESIFTSGDADETVRENDEQPTIPKIKIITQNLKIVGLKVLLRNEKAISFRGWLI